MPRHACTRTRTQVHLSLHGTEIKGSPVCFSVNPSKPDPACCKLSPPPDEWLSTDKQYALTLKTYDRFRNECKHGYVARAGVRAGGSL